MCSGGGVAVMVDRWPWVGSLALVVEESFAGSSAPDQKNKKRWCGLVVVQRMSLVYVCAEGEGFGDTFSRRHAERLDAAGGQHGWGGAYYLAALNTYSCSRSCFKLVALFSNSVRLTNHTPWKETVHSGITILWGYTLVTNSSSIENTLLRSVMKCIPFVKKYNN